MPDRTSLTRSVMLAPAAVARAAGAVGPPEQRWMLSQPKQVRASYVREVLDRAEHELIQQAWMLGQSDEVRESYIRSVLARSPESTLEEAWMLRQSRAVRESYLREVLAPAIAQLEAELEEGRGGA